jgi:hypothetical protein
MAITPGLIAGIATLSINGQSYVVRGKLAYKPSRVARESKIGQSGVAGFKEMPVTGAISMTLSDAGGLTVIDFNRMTDVTVTAQLANGKGVSGAGMWQTGEIEVDTEEGTFDVTFEGDRVEEFLL